MAPVAPSPSPSVAHAAAPVLLRSSVASVPASDTASLWKSFLAELWKKPSVASHMERAHLKSAGAEEWVIGFVDAFAMASVARAQTFLVDTAAAVAGRAIKVRLVQEPQDRREGEDATVVVASVAEEKAQAAVQDEGVRKALDVFKGKIRDS